MFRFVATLQVCLHITLRKYQNVKTQNEIGANRTGVRRDIAQLRERNNLLLEKSNFYS